MAATKRIFQTFRRKLSRSRCVCSSHRTADKRLNVLLRLVNGKIPKAGIGIVLLLLLPLSTQSIVLIAAHHIKQLSERIVANVGYNLFDTFSCRILGHTAQRPVDALSKALGGFLSDVGHYLLARLLCCSFQNFATANVLEDRVSIFLHSLFYSGRTSGHKRTLPGRNGRVFERPLPVIGAGHGYSVKSHGVGIEC